MLSNHRVRWRLPRCHVQGCELCGISIFFNIFTARFPALSSQLVEFGTWLTVIQTHVPICYVLLWSVVEEHRRDLYPYRDEIDLQHVVNSLYINSRMRNAPFSSQVFLLLCKHIAIRHHTHTAVSPPIAWIRKSAQFYSSNVKMNIRHSYDWRYIHNS